MISRPDRRWDVWLFAGLILVHLLPIWLVSVIPTQDGPAHLSMAHALRQLEEPGGEYLRETFAPNREAIPNWFVFFLLSKALRFLALPLAEKALLSAYVILLPLSALYALKAVRPGAGFLAVLVFPFTYNFLLNMGFYNFCFSLAAFLFSVGFWLRRGGRFDLLSTLGLALLVLWTYFCHPVTLGVLAGTLLTLASWRTFLELRRRAGIRALRWLLSPVMACAPAVILLLSFLRDRIGGRVSDISILAKIRQLASLYSLVSLDKRLLILSLALSLLLGLLTLTAVGHRSRQRRLFRSDGLFLATLLLTGIYLLAPNEMGEGGFVTHRLNLFPFLLLILWLGTFSFPEHLKTAVQAAGSAISLGLVAAMLAMWASLDFHLADILSSARHIEPRRTLLTLSFSNAGVEDDGTRLAFRTWPFVHAGSHLAARIPLVDLSLYEAHENYFPLVYRPERDPYTRLVRQPLDLEAEPPRADLLGDPKRTGIRIDYVLLVWPNAVPPANPAAREIRRQLAAGYKNIFVSPKGLSELYERVSRESTTGTSAAPTVR